MSRTICTVHTQVHTYVGEDGRQKWEVEHTLQHVYSRLKTGEV